MIKCCNCGEVFDIDECGQRLELVGEFWGSPAYDNVDVCPFCRSDDLEDYEEPDDPEAE